VFLNDQGRPFAKPLCNQRWDKIRKAAKLQDFHFHDLRHTHASILAQSGASLFQIGYQLGHKRADMTMRYAHLVPGVKLPGHDELDAKLTAK
jgi:integrase